MKVFHIISHLELGGAERVAINIAKSKNVKFKYHIVEVVRGNSEFTQEMIRELKENKIIYHRSPCPSKKLAILLFPFWFSFLWLRLKPDIIHTHTEIPDLSIYLFHLLTLPLNIKTKYVRTIHNTQLWNDWKRIGEKVEKFFIDKKSNVAISKATQTYYQKIYHQDNIPIIDNGINIIEKKGFQFLKENKLNVLFAGRLEKQKGIKEMIEVINGLKENTLYHFHIIGSGSLEYEVQKGLEGINYTLYNKTHNLSHYLTSFDYVFMPSNFEGLGLISIEASMSKTPTIINSCMGLKETLPEDWALKVKDNSVIDFLYLFNEILPNIDYQETSERAYSYAVLHFSIDMMQQKYEQIYVQQ